MYHLMMNTLMFERVKKKIECIKSYFLKITKQNKTS